MSNRFIPFTQVPPSVFVHYFQNLHRSTSNRNHFQQCVERMPDIPSSLVNLIIERSYEDVFQLEEQEIVRFQEETKNIGSSSSSRRSIVSERIMLLDKMDGVCAICLGEYKENEIIRALICRHEFHVHCIDKWLFQKKDCPLCRTFAM